MVALPNEIWLNIAALSDYETYKNLRLLYKNLYLPAKPYKSVVLDLIYSGLILEYPSLTKMLLDDTYYDEIYDLLICQLLSYCTHNEEWNIYEYDSMTVWPFSLEFIELMFSHPKLSLLKQRYAEVVDIVEYNNQPAEDRIIYYSPFGGTISDSTELFLLLVQYEILAFDAEDLAMLCFSTVDSPNYGVSLRILQSKRSRIESLILEFRESYMDRMAESAYYEVLEYLIFKHEAFADYQVSHLQLKLLFECRCINGYDGSLRDSLVERLILEGRFDPLTDNCAIWYGLIESHYIGMKFLIPTLLKSPLLDPAKMFFLVYNASISDKETFALLKTDTRFEELTTFFDKKLNKRYKSYFCLNIVLYCWFRTYISSSSSKNPPIVYSKYLDGFDAEKIRTWLANSTYPRYDFAHTDLKMLKPYFDTDYQRFHCFEWLVNR
jgi:hypothetical protein